MLLLASCGGTAAPSATVDPEIIARAAAGARAAAAVTPTPIPTPAPTPIPTPQPTHPYEVVGFTAEQLIIPKDQIPLTGFVVETDTVVLPFGWRRQFWNSGDSEFWWLTFYLEIYQRAELAPDRLERTTCSRPFSLLIKTREEIRAEVLGDGAKACLYVFESANVGEWVYYATRTRNVFVEVGVERRTATVAETTAQAVSLARRQLTIIERISPP